MNVRTLGIDLAKNLFRPDPRVTHAVTLESLNSNTQNCS
jgi:hypothetical protein